MTIVENIWKIRESKKISRREMAEHLCISQDTYKDIEYGKISHGRCPYYQMGYPTCVRDV